MEITQHCQLIAIPVISRILFHLQIPNHVASQFSTVCLSCHTVNPGWKPTTFNHSSFPLTLGHSTPDCIDCHIGGNYTTTPTDCYACHQQDFTASTNPNHTASGFSTACTQCHTTNPGWKPTTFNHSGFPLTLGHSTAEPAPIVISEGIIRQLLQIAMPVTSRILQQQQIPIILHRVFPQSVHMSYHKSGMETCFFQPFLFPAYTWSCRPVMCGLPYRRKLHHDTYGLLWLPSDRL